VKLYSTIIAGVILLTPCPAGAEDIYRYIDNQGTERFVDRVSAVPEQYRAQLKTVLRDLPDPERKALNPVIATHPNGPKPISPKLQSNKKVEIFITTWCPYCQKLEKFLKSRDIKYTRYDIEKDYEGQRLYQQLNAKGIPVIRIGGSQIIRGFDTAGILKALGK